MSYVFLDFECVCGEGTRHNEIIQIGAVKTDNKGNVIDTFNEFVRPVLETELTPYCKKLTGIRQEDVDNAKEFEEVRPIFEQWVGEDTIYTWGADVKMWNHNCYLIESDNNIYDQFVDYQDVMKKHFNVRSIKSLDFILKSLNLNSVYSHNALDDAISLYDYVKHVNPSFDNILFEGYSKEYVCELTITLKDKNYHFDYQYVHPIFGVFALFEFTVFNKDNLSEEKKEREVFKNKGKMKKLKAKNVSFNSFDDYYYFKGLEKLYIS